MPEFLLFLAFVLAAVVATGALLDKKRVRRSRRVLVRVGLFLTLPFFLLAFRMYMLLKGGRHYC